MLKIETDHLSIDLNMAIAIANVLETTITTYARKGQKSQNVDKMKMISPYPIKDGTITEN